MDHGNEHNSPSYELNEVQADPTSTMTNHPEGGQPNEANGDEKPSPKLDGSSYQPG